MASSSHDKPIRLVAAKIESSLTSSVEFKFELHGQFYRENSSTAASRKCSALISLGIEL